MIWRQLRGNSNTRSGWERVLVSTPRKTTLYRPPPRCLLKIFQDFSGFFGIFPDFLGSFGIFRRFPLNHETWKITRQHVGDFEEKTLATLKWFLAKKKILFKFIFQDFLGFQFFFRDISGYFGIFRDFLCILSGFSEILRDFSRNEEIRNILKRYLGGGLFISYEDEKLSHSRHMTVSHRSLFLS